MSPVPLSRRERLMSAVGPVGRGSNPGSVCSQTPEKSGMDLALSPPSPRVGVATTAVNASTREKFRHRRSIAVLLGLFDSAGSSLHNVTPARSTFEGELIANTSGFVRHVLL